MNNVIQAAFALWSTDPLYRIAVIIFAILSTVMALGMVPPKPASMQHGATATMAAPGAGVALPGTSPASSAGGGAPAASGPAGGFVPAPPVGTPAMITRPMPPRFKPVEE